MGFRRCSNRCRTRPRHYPWSVSESSAPDVPSFDQLGLDPKVEKVLRDVGYETPSPIQAEAIPPLLAGQHVVGLAQTGTGKTAAFALPDPLAHRPVADLAPGAGARPHP